MVATAVMGSPSGVASTKCRLNFSASLRARWMSSPVWAPAAFVSKVISRLAMGSMISDSRAVW